MGNNELITDKARAIKTIHEHQLGDFDMSRLSDELKNDKDVISTAVINNGYLFQDASDELRDDKEFVLELITQYLRYYKFGFSFSEDATGMIYFDQFSAMINFASDRLRDNEDVIRYAIRYDCRAIQCASERLKNDKEFILSINNDLSVNLYDYLSQALKDEENLIASIEKELDEYHEEHTEKK